MSLQRTTPLKGKSSFKNTSASGLRSHGPLKRSKKGLGIGKKMRTWNAIRAALKPRFQLAGITSCEFRFSGCWRDNGLGFAHRRKRRDCDTEELWICAIACNNCHDRFERLPHSEMYQIVNDAINARGRQP